MSDNECKRKLYRIDNRIDSLDLPDRSLAMFRTAATMVNMPPEFLAFSSTITADIASHPAWRSGKARYDQLLIKGKIKSAAADKRHQAWIRQAKAIGAEHGGKWRALQIARKIAKDGDAEVDTIYKVIRPALKSKK